MPLIHFPTPLCNILEDESPECVAVSSLPTPQTMWVWNAYYALAFLLTIIFSALDPYKIGHGESGALLDKFSDEPYVMASSGYADLHTLFFTSRLILENLALIIFQLAYLS